ncbi:MAG: hypothetical protein IPH21_09275 [Flavobacteriales bacterium]|nr:hypothetical protein [Flavobacteriales bacterium]
MAGIRGCGREGFLKDNSDAVARLMRVFRDQAKGFQEKKNAADIIASRYGMTPDNAAEWNRTLKWNLDGAVDVNALHGIADSRIKQEYSTKSQLRRLS